MKAKKKLFTKAAGAGKKAVRYQKAEKSTPHHKKAPPRKKAERKRNKSFTSDFSLLPTWYYGKTYPLLWFANAAQGVN
jgi:hypothetical protein